MPIAPPQHLSLTKLNIPLRWVLVIPFVLQTVGAVALVGYLSFRSGQRAVEDLASQLMQEKGERIVQNLEYYFKTPKALVREHQAAIELGILDRKNTSLIEKYFVQQLNIQTDVGGLMISTESKDFLSVGRIHPNQLAIRQRNRRTTALESYVANLQGKRLYLQDTLPNYDPHNTPTTKPWYQAAKKAKNGLWLSVVSTVRGTKQPLLIMAYFLPFTEPPDKLQGVISASVHLDKAGEFLRRLRIGKTGQAFIMNEQGLLIATSTVELPFRQNQATAPKDLLRPELLQLAVQKSQNPVTQAAATWSLNQISKGNTPQEAIAKEENSQLKKQNFSSPNVKLRLNSVSQFGEFRLQNKRYFGYIIPFQLDNQISWTIVLVVPESDFMAEIQASTHRTILLSTLALMSSILLGLWTARKITQPIQKLNLWAQAFSVGEPLSPLSRTGIQEVDALRVGFNLMMAQLNAAFQVLQENQQTLETFLNTVPVGVSVHAPGGQVIFINNKGKEIFNMGVTSAAAEELSEVYQLYQAGTDRYYPTEQLPGIRGLRGETVYIDDMEIDVQGRRVPIEVSAIPVFDKFGNVIYAINAFQDISDRLQSEKLLTNYQRELEHQVTEQIRVVRESKTQLELITDSVPGCISYIDASQYYRFVNKTYEIWFDCQKEDILGKTIQEVIGLEAYQKLLPYITQALAGKTITYEAEVPYQGNHIRYISAVLVPDIDEYQVVQGYYALITDISEQQAALRERKRAEAALRESEIRFRLAFDDAAIGMALVALDGQFMEVNQVLCDLVGYSETELLQKTCWTITHPEDFQHIEENVQKLLSGEQRSFQIKKRSIHKQGKVTWTIQSTSLIRDQNGTPLYCVSQFQDISARQVAERVKDEFISIVSHELRTPMTAICGALGILQSGRFDNQSDKFQHFLDMAVNNSVRLVRLLNDILDLERLESGSVELLIEECETGELMKQAVEAVHTLASQASITIKVVPISVNLLVSPGAIVQVITNLLSNAIKFSPPGSTIWLKAELVNSDRTETEADYSVSSYIRFCVQDEGRGIPPEKLETIFERFQQVDASDSRQKGGTGLGLAICKTIVQKHKGEIWVDSVLGEGSTFYFTIPVARSGKISF